MASITINGITLDPAVDAPALAARRMTAPDAKSSDYILVQTRGPLLKKDRDALAKAGAKVLEYVPEETYLCRFPGTDLSPVRALPFVAWTNVYLQAFKIPPALLESTPAGAPAAAIVQDEKFTRRQVSRPHKVQIILHQGVKAAAIQKKLADAVGMDPSDIIVRGHRVRLTVNQARLAKIARLDEVRHVEPVYPYKLHNNIARDILRAGQPVAGGVVLEGKGQVIAVCDTGFDKGSRTNVHPAFKGRVKKLYSLGRTNRSNDPDGHGTHVAGSVLGDGESAALGIKIRGTAPKAKLVLQSVLDSQGGLGGIPDDLQALFERPYNSDAARVHTNSWGLTGSFGRYTAESHDLDDFVWNHRDMVICFAAGNEGTDPDGNGQINPRSVTPPGTARNCITIGASENNRPDKIARWGEWWPADFPAAPIKNDLMANNPDGMVAFSSRGPTTDDRIKPDLVAPGSFILSTRSRDTQSEGWELTNDPLYFFEGGTSMATPLVAGCAAVVREFLIRRAGIPKPAASLVKAALINGAKDLSGQYTPSEAPSIPNNQEGFGRVDLARSIGPAANNESIIFRNEAGTLETGDEDAIPIQVPAGARQIKATLVWTDPAGETLQNDLDLIVRTGSQTERHGNQSSAGQGFDRRNNVEQVIWENPPAGTGSVIIRAHRITLLPQNYSIVIRIS